VQIPCCVQPNYRKKAGVWANQAALGYLFGCEDLVFEREKLDLDWAERGNPICAILVAIIHFDRRSGRIRTYIKNQEVADKQLDQFAIEARDLMKSHLLSQNPS
jgi:hypothetical protein